MSQPSKKSRKHGRSKRNGQAASYANEGRRSKNKARRLRKHFAGHPHDVSAFEALKVLGGALGKTIVIGHPPHKPENDKPGYIAWLRGQTGFRKGGLPYHRQEAA